MAKHFNIAAYNKILQEANQELRLLYYSASKIELSNGLVIDDTSEIRRCIRRVLLKSKEYLNRYDILYSLNPIIRLQAEKNAKSLTSSTGGKSVQQKYGTRIIEYNLTHKGIGTWKKGHISWNTGKNKYNHPSLMAISKSKEGSNNPMYGKKHTNDYKKEQSIRMKRKILRGDFTPNVKNSRTHWTAEYNQKKFRSSLEALFFALNPNCEFEKLRIKYLMNDVEYIYIVDFINEKEKLVYEIKPKSQCNEKTKLKEIALLEWAKVNDFHYEMISEDWFFNQDLQKVDWTLFNNETFLKLRKYYEIGEKRNN